MWDVGNFLLDPPSEQNNGDHRDDDLESNKDDSKKEPKVSTLIASVLPHILIAYLYPW